MLADTDAEGVDVELIGFEIPGRANQIFLPQIRWREDGVALAEAVREEFSHFGLLHHVFVDRSKGAAGQEDEEGYSNWFAAVDFYSTRAAKRARLLSHNQIRLGHRRCKVLASSRQRPDPERALALRNCHRLANHYLGFNGWNSQLASQTSLDDGVLSVVRLSFPAHGIDGADVSVEGAGLVEVDADGSKDQKGYARARARKASLTVAMQKAFSKVFLVVLDGGKKVAVEPNWQVEDETLLACATQSLVYDAGAVQEAEYQEGSEDEE